MVCMLLHWTEAFLCRQATATSTIKIPLKVINAPRNFIVTRKFTPPVKGFDKSVQFSYFYGTFPVLTTLYLQGQLNTLTVSLRPNWQNLQRPFKYHGQTHCHNPSKSIIYCSTCFSNLSIVCSQEMKTLTITPCSPEISPTGRDSSEFPSTLLKLPLTGSVNSCATKLRKRLLDHLMKASNPDWTHTPIHDIKIMVSRNRSR